MERLFRWAMLAAVVIATALWWMTGSWQWLVTVPPLSWTAWVGYQAIYGSDPALLAPERFRRTLPFTPRSERVANWAISLVRWAGLIAWAWTGLWWLAVIGVAVSVAATLVASSRIHRHRVRTARATFDEADRQAELGNLAKAIAAYDDVVTRFGDDPSTDLRRTVISAAFNKGSQLEALGHRTEAVAAYDDVVTRFGDAPPADLRQIIALAAFNKGSQLEALGHRTEAVAAWDDVVTRFNDDTTPLIREVVIRAVEVRAGMPNIQTRIREDGWQPVSAVHELTHFVGKKLSETREMFEVVAQAPTPEDPGAARVRRTFATMLADCDAVLVEQARSWQNMELDERTRSSVDVYVAILNTYREALAAVLAATDEA